MQFQRTPIVNAPLSHTLWYCFFYHSTASKEKLSSPFSLKTAFRVTDRRFCRSQLAARSKIGDWVTVKDMVTSKKSLFNKTPKSDIGFEPFVEAVFENKGPDDLLIYFLMLVESPLRRYTLAVRFKVVCLVYTI
jgi:hypothetical protein